MAEFTRDIKQLQQTASQSPTFSPPSKSLGGDIVNAIGTGLQFYAKNKAQNSLDAIAQKEMQDEQKLAEGVLKFREIRQTGENNTLSKTKRNSMETEFFKDYSPSMAMGILKTTNTITGDTVSEIDARIASAEKAEKAKEDEINIGASAWASQMLGMGQEEIDALTPEQREDFANKLDVMSEEIAVQKRIAEVSEDATAPILSQARTILQVKINAQLEKVTQAWRTGDNEGGLAAKDEFIKTIREATVNAPAKIRELMGKDKARFLDYGLVNGYTQQISSILDNPRVKDVLSGKDVGQEKINGVASTVNAYLSPQFFKAFARVKEAERSGGKGSAEDVNDVKNILEHFTNIKFGGNSLVSSGEDTLWHAVKAAGGDITPPPKVVDKGVNTTPTDTAPVGLEVVNFIMNSTASFFDKADVEAVSEGNAITRDYIAAKLDNGKELSPLDIQWMENSLTYGNTGNIDKKGKGASKAVLGAPLSIFARDDYKEKVKPAVDNAVSEGVDIISALTSSFDNHLRNNFKNAYTEIVNLGVSGMAFAETTGIRIDRSKPSSQKGSYNLRDKIELQNINGSLNFKYKEGTLGQSTDAGMITNLMNLNDSLVVVNDYVKAMSNVTGTEGKLVADEVMGLLNKYVNIPVESFTNEKQDYNLMASEQGVDLSSYEDGEYENGNGQTVVIKNGQVVSVK